MPRRFFRYVTLLLCAGVLASTAGCSALDRFNRSKRYKTPKRTIVTPSGTHEVAAPDEDRRTSKAEKVTTSRATTPSKKTAKPEKSSKTRVVTSSKGESLKLDPSVVSSEDRGVSAYRLKAGDPIIVRLLGIPKEAEFPDVIDEKGNINLTYIGAVNAAGKTTAEIERDIERAYIKQQIYKQLTVVVMVPSQGFFVRGEVNKAGRYQLLSGMTLMQALAAAGGYTEFANPKKVKVLRGGRTITVNMKDIEQAPDKDLVIDVGDVIVVPRSVF